MENFSFDASRVVTFEYEQTSYDAMLLAVKAANDVFSQTGKAKERGVAVSVEKNEKGQFVKMLVFYKQPSDLFVMGGFHGIYRQMIKPH